MKRSVKNLIIAVLIVSALIVAGLSSNASGMDYKKKHSEELANQQIVINVSTQNNDDKRDSAFWSRFRDSVIPNDRTPAPREPNTPDPENRNTPSRNKAM